MNYAVKSPELRSGNLLNRLISEYLNIEVPHYSDVWVGSFNGARSIPLFTCPCSGFLSGRTNKHNPTASSSLNNQMGTQQSPFNR